MISLWFCFLLHSILFVISQTSYRTYKIISSYELARPVMGTIFLVIANTLQVTHLLVSSVYLLTNDTKQYNTIQIQYKYNTKQNNTIQYNII